jgi:hypothetical protein
MRRQHELRRRPQAYAVPLARPTGLVAATVAAVLALAAVLATGAFAPGTGEPWLSGSVVEFLMPRR